MKQEARIKIVFFGSSQFSQYVLEELDDAGLSPVLHIKSAREPLPMDKLRDIDADVFVVASFGKILPEEVINMPKYKTLNVHPSLLPKLRGPAPIQGLILESGLPGVTIIRMDEKMDHGPILAQEEVDIEPWPDHYAVIEEKLGHAGGKLLSEVLTKWVSGEVEEVAQDESDVTYTKMIKASDAEISLDGDAEENYRKVLAYSTEPGAWLNFINKNGKEIRVKILDAKIEDSKLVPTKVVPAGKKEMSWENFLNGN